jgi:hypothetical protein
MDDGASYVLLRAVSLNDKDVERRDSGEAWPVKSLLS